MAEDYLIQPRVMKYSVELPGVNEMISRTGLLGKLCASIGKDRKIPNKKINPLCKPISYLHVFWF